MDFLRWNESNLPGGGSFKARTPPLFSLVFSPFTVLFPGGKCGKWNYFLTLFERAPGGSLSTPSTSSLSGFGNEPWCAAPMDEVLPGSPKFFPRTSWKFTDMWEALITAQRYSAVTVFPARFSFQRLFERLVWECVHRYHTAISFPWSSRSSRSSRLTAVFLLEEDSW